MRVRWCERWLGDETTAPEPHAGLHSGRGGKLKDAAAPRFRVEMSTNARLRSVAGLKLLEAIELPEAVSAVIVIVEAITTVEGNGVETLEAMAIVLEAMAMEALKPAVEPTAAKTTSGGGSCSRKGEHGCSGECAEAQGRKS